MIRPSLLLPAALALLPVALPPTPAGAQGFSGPRVEVMTGYDRLGRRDALTDLPDTFSGAGVRLGLGYDREIAGRLVIGAGASAGATAGAGETATLGRDRYRFRPGRDIDLMARIGVKAGRSTLLYATAGYAVSRIALRQTSAGETARSHDAQDGWRYGAGVERQLGGRFFGRAEYRRTDYSGRFDYQFRPARDQFLVGGGLRF